MSKTQTAATAHGEVSYETVGCANCGSETLPDESVTVGVGLYHTACDGVIICDAQVLEADERATLCVHCSDAIFGYGRTRREKLTRSFTRTMAQAEGGSWELVVMAALAFAFVVGLVVGVGV